jgi:hypothetical protein
MFSVLFQIYLLFYVVEICIMSDNNTGQGTAVVVEHITAPIHEVTEAPATIQSRPLGKISSLGKYLLLIRKFK